MSNVCSKDESYDKKQTNDKSSQVLINLPSSSPSEQQYKAQIKRLQNKLGYYRKNFVSKTKVSKMSEDDLLQMCFIKFGGIAKTWEEQIKLSKAKTPNGHRFSEDTKKFALKQYFHSPMAYKSLKKSWILPSKNTLLRMVSHIPNRPGLHQFIFNKIRAVTEHFSLRDKCCMLMLDEMSCKRNLFYEKHSDKIIGFHDDGKSRKNLVVSHVLVLMARGISTRWKQTLGMCYIAYKLVIDIN